MNGAVRLRVVLKKHYARRLGLGEWAEKEHLVRRKEGPWGAQCALPPYLEGNTGLERYEGGAKVR